MTEEELAIRCKQGNQDAYKELYEAYSQQMKGVSLRYVGSEDLAHDVLHDGFVKVFVSIHQFQYKGDGSLKAWISKIIVNTALAYLKKNQALSYVEQIENYEITDEDNTDLEILSSISSDIIMAFIQELPVGCRTVFNLYMLEDLSHDEIGKQLNIKEVASRVRLSRAKAILAKKIDQYIKQNE